VVGPFGRVYFISYYFQHSDPIDLYLDARGSSLQDFIIQYTVMLVNTPSELLTYFSIHGKS
jgi:hypothetical protein